MSNTDEDKILDILVGIQLDQFYRQIVNKLHVTRFSHFDHVAEEDLDGLSMSKPEQRRLFEALKKARKKTLFGSFRRKKSKNKLLTNEPESDQATTSPPTPFVANTIPASSSLTCLINEKSITLYDMIGNGAFGYVRNGEWITDSKQKIDVAVKCLKVSRDAAFLQMQMDFIKEANAMSLLDHPHIIKLYGVVLATPLMLVTELAPLGCLLTCLRNNQPKFLISQLSNFVIQVASGMAYLETEHYIHRDLAARNLLLSAHDMVKIGDFGLMRPLSIEEDYYTMNPKGKVPFAWCPPESLKFRKFSHASDVWAFGITVTEMFSYGVEPWPGLNGGQILQKVDLPQSERPQKPSHCPSKIYNILFSYCWAHDPANRPKFSALQNIFEAIHPQDARVIRSYDSRSPQNLCFEEGDVITIIESSSDSSWWRGQNKRTRRVGMFPCELVEGGKSSGSSSPKGGQNGVENSRKLVLSPNCSTTRKKQCDCGEEHVYDFPVLLNSPTPSSPDGTRNSVRSFDGELIFNAESDSGYSSSADRFLRSNSDCSQDLKKDVNASYKNCESTSYELMEPGLPLPSRPVAIPEKENGSPRAILSDPVSVPVKHSIRERLSDPNPTHKCEPERKAGPFGLTRRVSAKKLNSFSIPPKNAESSLCPLDFTTSVGSSKRNSGIKSPPPLPPKEGTSRPNSRNSSSSTSPQKSPVLLPRSDSCKGSSIGESFADEMMTFIRSCSSEGFDAETLNEAQRVMNNQSSSKNIARLSDNVGVSGRSRLVGGRARSQTEVLSPSEKEIPGRSNSVGGRTQYHGTKTEIYENHVKIPRSKSAGSKSLEYENHVTVVRQDISFQTYDNAKLKSVISTEEQSSPFYENHVLSLTAGKGSTTSSSFGMEISGSNVESEQSIGAYYDNHKLLKENLKNSERNDGVSYENYSLKSVPQNYEKMVLRKSFIEIESVPEGQKTKKEVEIEDESVNYENCTISTNISQPCYENFVLVEHSEIPGDISSDSNNLKCPSYENHGFSELEAAGKEALKTEETTELQNKQSLLVKDNSDILSKSVPTSCDWKLVKESVQEDGSVSVLVEVLGNSCLRKTSSDGDVSESKQNKKTSSRPESDDNLGPIPPPRWKKKAKEARKQQTRWSLNVTGDLANVLSNYFHQNEKSMESVKEVRVNSNNLDQTDNPTLPPHVNLSEKDVSSDVLERKSKEISSTLSNTKFAENTIENTMDTIQVSLPSSEKSLSAPEQLPIGIVSKQQADSFPSQSPKKEAPSIESPSCTTKELTNGLDDVELNEDEAKPQRPNVLCFENKLAGFAEIFQSQINEYNPDTKDVMDDAPALPPKAKSPVTPSGRRNPSKSQYKRLSRDPTNTKLSFGEDKQRYRPCPTNGSIDKTYDFPQKNLNEDTAPPLPRKVSKAKHAPEVPPRPDLACS